MATSREEIAQHLAEFFAKHSGPGPHPSGSPQSAHAGSPVTRFEVRDGGKLISTHTHYGDARDARRKIVGVDYDLRGTTVEIVRVGSPEFEPSDLERQIGHLPPKK